jgi:diaminopimelate epimerase|tara:strand:- start:298 stop:513 length:216 start_codon:yes stop_codon:yes gene_type:complete
MKKLFKLIKSDEPTLTDNEYVYTKDKSITIQICGNGVHCVNKWVESEQTMYHSPFMSLAEAMKLIINTERR